jgi:GTPase SAR1 family protein
VIRYRNHDFAVEMIDTAGQDEYSILNSKHFIGIHGYMIVYSVGSKQSFEMVRIIRDKILNHLVRVQSLSFSSRRMLSQTSAYCALRLSTCWSA